MAYYPNWVLYQAEALGVDPEDIFGPPIEVGSHEHHRERFKQKRWEESCDYLGNECRIGMVDQASASPENGSPDLDELIAENRDDELRFLVAGKTICVAVDSGRFHLFSGLFFNLV